MNPMMTVQDPLPLLEFLFRAMPGTKKGRVKKWLKFECVSVNGKVSTQFNYPLAAGDEVRIAKEKTRPLTPAARFNLEIVYEDDYLILIDKPAGLLTIGSEKVPRETAIFALNDYLNKKHAQGKKRSIRPCKRVFVVHRLDRDVSGLVLFAKDEKTKLSLQEGWKNVKKEYWAVVEGCPAKPSGTLESYLTENRFLKVYSGPKTAAAKKAVTHYEVLKHGKNRALLKVALETGRKHQIRVHLADMGHPIVGDTVYGALKSPLKRIALHACRLEFEHPVTRKKHSFFKPLPAALERLLYGS